MNFKPNAWTLLFALALGALLYQMNMTKTDASSDSSMANTCPPTVISPSEFHDDFNRFLGYGEFLDSLFTEGADSIPQFRNGFEKYASLVNPEVWSFHIPKCEMREMLDLNPDGDYYAYLIMKNETSTVTKKDSMVIDLAFSHKYVPGNNSSKEPILASKGLSKSKDDFFDFTAPCPPLCDTSKVAPNF